MNSECLFCKIAAGEIPGDMLGKADGVIAFRDINAQAPTHILVIPTEHIPSIEKIDSSQSDVFYRLLKLASDLAVSEGISDSGYRIVINKGVQGGQTVDHLHMHLLGGRQMVWPPG